jgi:hypothetical protein
MTKTIFVDLLVFTVCRPKNPTPKHLSTLKFSTLIPFPFILLCKRFRRCWFLVVVLIPFPKSNFPKFVKLNLLLIGHKCETRLHHNEANYGRCVLSVLINNTRKTEPPVQRFLTSCRMCGTRSLYLSELK